uniref:CWH43-like N-terminal domain-containing protein n=1 Tax=Arion vulgaris TaxID=1028688 RepID=A0A0B7AE25_9EUPU
MSYLGLLPISLVLLAAINFGISYIIAVMRDDVRAVFPYISDTGSKRPESCVFGQLLNIVGFLAFWTMYIRYKAVQAISHTTLSDDRKLNWLNKISLFLGLVSAFGTSIVANFQEGTVVEGVHIFGAIMTFIAGVLYCLLQTVLSYHMYPSYNGLYICRIRLGISVTAAVSLIMTILSAVYAFRAWNSIAHSKSKFKWAPDDVGYTAHIVSTVGEWFTALTFLFYFFTFVQEFDKFDMEIRTRPLVHHLDQILDRNLRVEVNERSGLLS